MKCPLCGEEMARGTLRGRGPTYFLPDGARNPVICTKGAVEKKGGILLPPSPLDTALPPAWPQAYYCRACRWLMLKNEE